MSDSRSSFGSSEVESFIREFESGTLGRARWTHAAHLMAGFWYVHRLGVARALDEMRGHIRHHNESVGTPNTDQEGYHETLTRLYLLGIDALCRTSASREFEAMLSRVLASNLANNRWPLTYYSRDRLFSVAARREWVEPDLATAWESGSPAEGEKIEWRQN